MESAYSAVSQTPVVIALRVVYHTYPERDKYIKLATLAGQSLYEALIPNAMYILQES